MVRLLKQLYTILKSLILGLILLLFYMLINIMTISLEYLAKQMPKKRMSQYQPKVRDKVVKISIRVIKALSRHKQVLVVLLYVGVSIKRILFSALYGWYISLICFCYLKGIRIVITLHIIFPFAFSNYHILSYHIPVITLIILLTLLLIYVILWPATGSIMWWLICYIMLILVSQVCYSGFSSYNNFYLNTTLFTIHLLN